MVNATYNSAKGEYKQKNAYCAAGIGGGSSGNGTNIKIYGNAYVKTYGGATSAGIGDGSLGNGINITIDGSAVVEAYGDNGGAGIGGGQRSNGSSITISGKADVTANGGMVGAGIGGGSYGGNGSGITISGEATVTATGNSGAGIGGGQNGSGGGESKDDAITISGDVTVVATGNSGAGIGGGYYGSANNIIIENCKKVEAQSTNGGAGIGGGTSAPGSNITISGGEVIATSGDGAGIGGGGGGAGTNITIHDCKVTATSTDYGGAGIGGGNGGEGKGITIYDAYVEATGASTGAGIGGGQSRPGSDIHIYTDKGETTVIAKASKSGYGAGIGGGANGAGTNIAISGNAVVVATSGDHAVNGSGYGAGIGSGRSGAYGVISDITISGNADVTAGSIKGAGIGDGNYAQSCAVTIEGGNVKATSEESVGIGCTYGPSTITISGGTVVATGVVGIGSDFDIATSNPTDETRSPAVVKIKGTSSESYPWVFTNSIKSANYVARENDDEDGYWGIVFEFKDGDTFNDIEDNNFNEGIVYGTKQEVKITDDYTLTAGKKLTVLADVTLITDNKFTLDSSVLYLKEGATLDKWYKMEKKGSGEIQHEDSSRYEWYNEEKYGEYEWFKPSQNTMNNEKGVFLCDICGTPEPHHPVMEDGWKWNETHHWHLGTCDLGDDCAVYPFTSAITKCSYIVTVDGEDRFDYGEHRYDFNNPGEAKDGKWYFYCIDCAYPIAIDIPTISLNKVGVDAEGEAPLAGAEFGLYTNAGCTGEPFMTGTTTIDADGNAVVSFDIDGAKYINPNTIYYIKETNAPDGYRKSNEVFAASVTIAEGKGKVTYGNVGAEITSEAIPVCKNYAEEIASDPAKLIKVDGEGKPLEGAVFGIYSDAECTTLITTAVTAIDTDETSDTYNKAIVIFDTELNGTYYIKETKAPDGYTISDKIFKVTVDEKGKVTYGDDGSEKPPVCENIAIEPEPDDPTPDDPTPDDPTPDDPTPDDPTPDDPTPDDPTPDDPTPDDPTPDDPTPDDPTPGPDDNDTPNTGVGIGIAGLMLLGGSLCAVSVTKRRRK